MISNVLGWRLRWKKRRKKKSSKRCCKSQNFSDPSYLTGRKREFELLLCEVCSHVVACQHHQRLKRRVNDFKWLFRTLSAAFFIWSKLDPIADRNFVVFSGDTQFGSWCWEMLVEIIKLQHYIPFFRSSQSCSSSSPSLDKVVFLRMFWKFSWVWIVIFWGYLQTL